jgi:hypothetical protein
MWRPGSRNGLPPIVPCSFANAMTEPVKVTEPMQTPIKISIRWIAMPPASTCCVPRYVAKPTSTAASPTKLCSAATSCGIDVI